MKKWKMTDPEKGGILQDRKMVEKVAPENDGMENDRPGKRQKITGPENDSPGK